MTTLKKKKKCVKCERDIDTLTPNIPLNKKKTSAFCSHFCAVSTFFPLCKKLKDEAPINAEEKTIQMHPEHANLRFETMKNPLEIYKTEVDQDNAFTLISKYTIDFKPIWNICFCLFDKDNTPYFFCYGFVTKNNALVDSFKNTKAFSLEEMKKYKEKQTELDCFKIIEGVTDSHDLIAPSKQEDLFFQTTLEFPDEVWSVLSSSKAHYCHHHLIRSFQNHPEHHNETCWYVIVAKDTDLESEIEILEAFLTDDIQIVSHYRKGKKFIPHDHLIKNQPLLH
jgi:hypothetical protein